MICPLNFLYVRKAFLLIFPLIIYDYLLITKNENKNDDDADDDK